MNQEIVVKPFTFKCAASILPPGSKSITNRAMLLAALIGGKTRLEGALFSRDTEIMADCLTKLGYVVNLDKYEKTIEIESLMGQIPNSVAELNVGNAGTAARFISALVALKKGGKYKFDGDEAMRARPMAGLINALKSQGAQFEFLGAENSFPFVVRTCGLKGGEVSIDASASSQMLSALLMVSAFADSPMSVVLDGGTVSKPFVKMTIEVMAQFGIDMARDGRKYEISSPARRNTERVYKIEPDATAASYFEILPAVVGGACEIENFADCKLQGDSRFGSVRNRRRQFDCRGGGARGFPEACGARFQRHLRHVFDSRGGRADSSVYA